MIHYRRQGKVMFSEASVSHTVYGGGSASRMGGGLHLRGLRPEKGSAFGGLHPGRSASRRAGRGSGRPPGSASRGGGQIPLIMASSDGYCRGRYESYWNVFLLFSTASVGIGLAEKSLKKNMDIIKRKDTQDFIEHFSFVHFEENDLQFWRKLE